MESVVTNRLPVPNAAPDAIARNFLDSTHEKINKLSVEEKIILFFICAWITLTLLLTTTGYGTHTALMSRVQVGVTP